jgi:hypothetical protein
LGNSFVRLVSTGGDLGAFNTHLKIGPSAIQQVFDVTSKRVVTSITQLKYGCLFHSHSSAMATRMFALGMSGFMNWIMKRFHPRNGSSLCMLSSHPRASGRVGRKKELEAASKEHLKLKCGLSAHA